MVFRSLLILQTIVQMDDDFDDISDSELLAHLDESQNVNNGSKNISNSSSRDLSQSLKVLEIEKELTHVKKQLAEVESTRDRYRGETVVLRSNLEKFSQAHQDHIKSVQQSQTTEKSNYQKELTKLKEELDSLRSRTAFFQHDIKELQHKNKTLEHRLIQSNSRPASQMIGSANFPNDEENENSVQSPPHENNTLADLNDSPRKRPRSNLVDSYMDGFAFPAQSPKKRNRISNADVTPTTPSKSRSRRSRIFPLESSSEKSSVKIAPSSSPRAVPIDIVNNIEQEKYDELANRLERTNATAVQGWKVAERSDLIMEFVNSCIGHKIDGISKSTFELLNEMPGKEPKLMASELSQILSTINLDLIELKDIVKTFCTTVIMLLKRYSKSLQFIKSAPLLLLILYNSIHYFPTSLVSDTLIIKDLCDIISEFLNHFPTEASSEFEDRIPYMNIYLNYSILFGISILEFFSSATFDTKSHVKIWSEIPHSFLIRIISLDLPLCIKMMSMKLCLSSITDSTFGHVHTSKTDDGSINIEPGSIPDQTQDEIELMSHFSDLLTEFSPVTSFYNLFSNIDNQVQFPYVPLSTFFQNLNSIEILWDSQFSPYEYYGPTDIDEINFHFSRQTNLLNISIKQNAIQFFMSILFNRNPRVISDNDLVLSSVITCLAHELDLVFNRVSGSSSDYDESVQLIEDCIRLLHAIMSLVPDYISCISKLPPNSVHEHFVCLVQIYFANTLVESGNKNKGDNLEQIGPKFDATTIRKTSELLENTITEEESEELFASMSHS